MPGWETCQAEEHTSLGSMLTGHHGSHILLTHCKCAAAFHHAANTPQLHLRKDSVLTHNRFCCIDDTCRFWALHLSCTTHPDHPQLEGSAVHINTAAHAFAQRFKPHLAPQPHRITSHPDHKPHPTITRIQTPIVSDHNCIGSTVAHHGPSHKLCSRYICKQRSMAGYGILHARTGFKLSEDGAFPEDGEIVKVFPLYNQPLPPQR